MVLCLTAKDNNKESGDREHPEELTTKFWSLRPYRRHSSPVNQSNKFSAFYCFFSPSYKTMTSLSLFAKFWQPGHRQLLSGHQPFTLSSSFNRVVLALAAQLLQGPAGLLKISGRDTVVHCAVRARPGKDELLGKPRGAGSLGCLASPGQQNSGNASCCPPRTTMGRGVGVLHFCAALSD